MATLKKLDRFVFIGRLGTQKQVDHLIKAYQQFLTFGHETNLTVFGPDEANQNN